MNVLTQEVVFEKLESLYKAENKWQSELERLIKIRNKWLDDEWWSIWGKKISEVKIKLHYIREQIHDLELVFDVLEPQGYTVIEI